MKIDPSAAYAPPDLRKNRDEIIVAGIKNWHERGQFADEGQGKAVLSFIIEELCRTHDLSFRPESMGGQRDTDFHEGRRFVGLQIRRIITGRHDELLLMSKRASPPTPPAAAPARAGK